MSASPLSVDVLIVGAGPAGSALALACAKWGIRVAVLSRGHRSGSKPSVEMLPPQGEFLLRSLGIAPDRLEGVVRSDETRVCWETPSLARNLVTLDPHGSHWHISRDSFDKALVSAARAQGVEYVYVPTFSHLKISRMGSKWNVQTEHLGASLSLTSDLIVDGSGVARLFARARGGVAIRDDLLAIIWTVVEHHDDHSALLIEASPEGWWYSLGQPDGTLLCALVVDARSRANSRESRLKAWQRAWEQSQYSRHRAPYQPAQLSIAIAESGRLSTIQGEGWFAIGDAAASFDPLSSNGLSSAMEQSIALSQVIAAGATLIERSQYDDLISDRFERYRKQRKEMYKRVFRFSHHEFWLCRSR